MKDSDREGRLLDRLRSRDREAFRELVTSFHEMVFNLILRMVRNRELAEDLTQDTFIRVYQALPSFLGKSSLSTWLYRIAYNVAMNELARASHRYETTPFDELPAGGRDARALRDEGVDVAGEIEEAEAVERINRLIDDLKPEQRWAMTLYYHDERTYREISDIMGIPIGTVKTLLYRARETLRERLRNREIV